MKNQSLTTVSLLFFFLFTISHALYLFTDLTHLANVDIDADDDYRGPPKIHQKPATIEVDLEERERVSAPRFGDLIKERRRNPASMRFFPRQCRYHKKSRVFDQNVVELMLRKNKGGFESSHVGGRLSTRGGSHGKVFQHKFPGADADERGQEIMMMMLKRPHFLVPRQHPTTRHVSFHHHHAIPKRKEAAAAKKRPEREEEATKGENIVINKIRKFLTHF